MLQTKSSKGSVEQIAELLGVLLAIASGGGGRDSTAGIRDISGLVAHLSQLVAETRLHKAESTLVLWFFLSPHDLGVLVSVEGTLDVSEGEWRELLNSDDGNILDSSLGSLVLEVVVDLARAVDDLADGSIVDKIGGGVVEHFLVTQTLLEVIEVRVGVSQLEQLLGGNNDQRLTESSLNLSSQQVEVLGSGGRVSNAHVRVLSDGLFVYIVSRRLVISVSELKISFNSA